MASLSTELATLGIELESIWRISNHVDLSGEGGRKASARWHTKGRRIVYLAESPAGAMLEHFVHLMDKDEEGNLPPTYQLLEVSVADGIAIKSLKTIAPVDWKDHPEFTRQIGDAWLASRETALARVPSAILPRTWNCLLNPEHPDAKQLKIESVIHEHFDDRLFRFGAR